MISSQNLAMFVTGFVSLSVLFNISISQGSDESDLGRFLRDFHENPAEVMERTPVKRNEFGEAVEEVRSPSIEERDEIRSYIMSLSESSQPAGLVREKKPFSSNDRVENLVDGEVIRNAQALEDRGFTVGQSEHAPWSDSYWPIQKGLLGNRYADPGYPESRSWPTNHAYILARPFAGIFASGNGIDNLSPSEKYDALVGDMSGTMTNFMWRRGERYQSQYGTVPGWMGICHGWSAAAIMDPEPQRAVTVTSTSGKPIRFFISDIKGLLSGLWSFAMPHSRFIGGRCRINTPQRDQAGRIIAGQCFDTNPGTWHLAITNQIGKNRLGFVMDATYDGEVWNHPVYKYQYTYFNPQTLEPVSRLRQAVVPVSQFTIDKFKPARSRQAAYVAGVAMDVTYMSEMKPNHAARHAAPIMKSVTYIYDLELDANGNIIGGEWYLNKHPDFLWGFSQDARPTSRGDRMLGDSVADWDGSGPVPAHWRDAAVASSRRGAPLAQIIYTILELAKDPLPASASTSDSNPSPTPSTSPSLATE